MKEIKEMLLDNPEHIENILVKLGFYKVRKYKNKVICGNSINGHGNSIHIKLNEDISCKDYKCGQNGDIFSFLMKKRNLELYDVLEIVKQELGIESFNFHQKKDNSVFGGFYKKIKRRSKNTIEYEILDESILNPYINKYNMRFFRDNISFVTQKKFQIGIDFYSQRISVPWRSYYGQLIGIMGRYLGDDEDIKKWMPIIPFPKLDAIYGYFENYKYLVECDELYVGESEKFTLQLDSYSINTCVSLGRNEISSYQVKRLIMLNPKKIIFCLDESLPEDISIKNVELTKKLLRYHKIEVGYIYDKENEILPKDSKAAPSDFNKDVFMELIKKKVIWC